MGTVSSIAVPIMNKPGYFVHRAIEFLDAQWSSFA